MTAGVSTPYAKARALQDYLRNNYTYDLRPRRPRRERPHPFPVHHQWWACEQFAGSYAAMARSVGLPSRVGVGFTPDNKAPTAIGS